VYRYKDERVTLVCDKYEYPNGLCFSPDESYLYICSNKKEEAAIWRYHVSASGEATEDRIIVNANGDGIKTDKKGNLFLCTDEGILILSAQGKKIALLPLTESPANIAWVKPACTELYITARSSVYRASGF